MARYGRSSIRRVAVLTLFALGVLVPPAASVASATPPAGPLPVGVPPSGTGGAAVSWGADTDPAQENSLAVPAMLTGQTVEAVSAGTSHALALVAGGTVVGWGENDCGDTVEPESLTGRTVTAIAAGNGFSLALTSDGQVTGWGCNRLGSLNLPPSLTGKTVTAIATGGDSFHSLALTSDGHVVAWGGDVDGDTVVPASLQDETVTAIAAGYSFSVALTAAGRVVVWGDDSGGETDVPASLDGRTVTAIAAGAIQVLAITSDGSVTTWGGGDYYGVDDLPASLTGKTVVAVAGGYDVSLALTSDGDLIGWGFDWEGEADPPGALAGHGLAIAAGLDFAVAIAVPGPDYVEPVLTTRYPHPRQYSYRAKTTSPDGTAVDFLLPTAYDAVDGPEPVTCTPASGSVFPVGRTRVVCTATDSSGNTGTTNIFVSVEQVATRIEVTGLSPASGSVAGGTVVTLTGHGFTGAQYVGFGFARTTDFTVDSDTRITVVAPAASPYTGAGFVHIFVHGRGFSSGLFQDRFHYLPEITGLSPAVGSHRTPVTITGHGFTGARSVTFGTTPARSFTVVSDTEVAAVAPPLPLGQVDLRVTVPGGTTPVVDADRYTMT